ncbi:MAG: hypothetical protein MPW14_03165 [Candidatus Manganitrophus sp.]|nr:MAG: hypothetical protein MPW14_03165 [Candidatus Manganitrophus sp.]
MSSRWTRPDSRSSAAAPATTGPSSRRCCPSEYDIQINKTSRNSVLVQTNINNTRSDLAHFIKALADMARKIDQRLQEGGDAERAAFEARVKSLVEDVPALPDFSAFHDAFRDDPKSATKEGSIRAGVLHGLRRRELRVHPAHQQGDRRPAEERTAVGLGQIRHPLPARLPDHGAGPGHHRRRPSRTCASWMSKRFTVSMPSRVSNCSGPMRWRGTRRTAVFRGAFPGTHGLTNPAC